MDFILNFLVFLLDRAGEALDAPFHHIGYFILFYALLLISYELLFHTICLVCSRARTALKFLKERSIRKRT